MDRGSWASVFLVAGELAFFSRRPLMSGAALQDENDERRRIRRNPGAINRLEIFVDVFRGEERRKKMCRIKRLLDFYTLVLDLELDSSLSRSEVKREMILFLVRGIR